MDLVPYATTVYAFSVLCPLAFSFFAATPLVVTRDLAPPMGILLSMAIVSQIGGHTLYNYSLRHVSATVVSATPLGEPVGASILLCLLLGEAPGGGTPGACPATRSSS